MIDYVLGEYPDTPEGNLMQNVKASWPSMNQAGQEQENLDLVSLGHLHLALGNEFQLSQRFQQYGIGKGVFGNIVHRAFGQSRDDRFGVVAVGKQDDGDAGCGRGIFELLAYLKPVHLGHLYVQHDQIRLCLLCRFQTFRSVWRP